MEKSTSAQRDSMTKERSKRKWLNEESKLRVPSRARRVRVQKLFNKSGPGPENLQEIRSGSKMCSINRVRKRKSWTRRTLVPAGMRSQLSYPLISLLRHMSQILRGCNSIFFDKSLIISGTVIKYINKWVKIIIESIVVCYISFVEKLHMTSVLWWINNHIFSSMYSFK